MLQLKTWGAKAASNHSAFTGKWLTVISFIHLEDELSFKGMRIWGQSKISSCCICDWCKSRRMKGRGSPRLPTPVVESFSGNLFPVIKSYCTESPFELRILLGEQDIELLHIMSLLLEWGEKVHFFVYICSRNCIIIVIISIIVYIFVVVVCQNRQVNRLNKWKHEIPNSALFYLFYPALLPSVTYRSTYK